MARRDDDDDDDDRDDERRSSKGKPSAEEKQMAMFCHLGLLIGGFVIPLILWIMKKDESRFIDRHGKEALNFALTLGIGHLLGICTFGILNMVLLVLGIIFAVQAGMAANRGENYRYAMNIRFIS